MFRPPCKLPASHEYRKFTLLQPALAWRVCNDPDSTLEHLASLDIVISNAILHVQPSATRVLP